MHAIRQHEFGPAGNLRFERVPDPEPGPGQVRVTVSAAGVHLLDTTIRRGESGGPFPLPRLPMTPGREVAGVVTKLGDGVEPRWLGTRVVAHLGQASGGYAELAVVNTASLHALPDHVSDDAAVAMIGTGRTAFGVLRVAELDRDDVVLVTSAAGGLGALFVQEAKAVGAKVIGVASTPKLDLVRGLGADVVADYTRPGWADGIGEVTVVLDGVGGENGRQALERLAIGGRVLLYGWTSGEPTRIETADLYRLGISATVVVGPRMMKGTSLRGLEEAALAALAEGRLTPPTTTFPLSEAAGAHTALEGRATVGKVVLKP
ncbi:MAG: zinc-binding dehydrogenase [Saccharothrix sp.]|nr:zinc-binding dehydrogenase [Saccharothrix sp.]